MAQEIKPTALEQLLISTFRKLPEQERDRLMRVLEALAASGKVPTVEDLNELMEASKNNH